MIRNLTIRALLIPLLLLATGCTIWRPSGGGLLNPCGSHRCDARPASYKKPDVAPCKKGEMVYVYHPDTGLREVQIAPPLCAETRTKKKERLRIKAERQQVEAQR